MLKFTTSKKHVGRSSTPIFWCTTDEDWGLIGHYKKRFCLEFLLIATLVCCISHHFLIQNRKAGDENQMPAAGDLFIDFYMDLILVSSILCSISSIQYLWD